MADLIDLENMIYAIAEAHKNGAEINFSERAVHVLAKANAVRIEMINEMCEGIDPEQCDEQLFIQLVSNRTSVDFKKLRDAYFKEHVTHKTTDGIPTVCTHPHNLFEWFKAELKEYGC